MDRPKGSLVAYEIIAPSASAAGDLSAKYADPADKSACCMTAWLLHAAIMTAAGFKYKHPGEPSLDTIMFAAIANLRIFTKISLGVASVLGLLVVASTWTYISMSRLDSLFAEYRDRAELITLADKLLGDMNSYGFIAQSYARTGEETLLGKASEIGGASTTGSQTCARPCARPTIALPTGRTRKPGAGPANVGRVRSARRACRACEAIPPQAP